MYYLLRSEVLRKCGLHYHRPTFSLSHSNSHSCEVRQCYKDAILIQMTCFRWPFFFFFSFFFFFFFFTSVAQFVLTSTCVTNNSLHI